MKHLLLIFVLLFVMNNAVGKNGELYFKYINLAELAITDNDCHKAINFYDSAFISTDFPLGEDLYNCCICAIELNLNKKAMELCFALSKKGVGEKFFTENSIFSRLKFHNSWRKLLANAKQENSLLNVSRMQLVHKIDSLTFVDQEVNAAWRKSGRSKEKRKEMDSTYRLISKFLLDIFKAEGYLNEELIGLPMRNDSIISSTFVFEVIIVHNYQSFDTNNRLFKPILIKAIQDGKIKPEKVAKFEDFGTKFDPNEDYGTTQNYIKYNCSLYKKKDFDAKNLNKSRKSILLYPIEDLEKKILYNTLNPSNPYLINAFASTFGSFANPDAEANFLNSYEILISKLPNCN